MQSALPKVLHEIAGRPLLAHVIDAARSLKPERIYVVHGHGGDGGPRCVRRHRRRVGRAGAPARHRARADAGAAQGAARRHRAGAERRRAAGARPRCCASLFAPRAGESPLPPATSPIRPATGAWCATRKGRVQRIVEHKDAKPAELRHPRVVCRLPRRQRVAAGGLAGQDRQPQRAEGVLPHRRHRHRRGVRREGEPRSRRPTRARSPA